MAKTKRRKARGLFRSVSVDGAHWLFVIQPDDGWAIMRDGQPISTGTGDRVSLDAGVREFLSLTLSVVGIGRVRRGDRRSQVPAVPVSCEGQNEPPGVMQPS